MLRRHHATALLALATLLGAQMPAAAESGPLSPSDRGVPPVLGRSMAPSVIPAPSVPAPAPAEIIDPWVERIDERLAAIEQAARERTARVPAQPEPSALTRRLADIAASGPRSATVGIAVRQLETGTPVFDWREHEALNPASNQKLLTAAAALELLGADYRFKTRVLLAGDTLVLAGEGDPSLQVDHLEAIAERVAETIDLSEIRRIVVDDTAFSARRFGPGYDPEGPGVSYMAPSGALSLQWNTVELGIRGAASGQPVTVHVSPPNAHITVRSSATGGRGSVVAQTRAAGEHTAVDVRGHLSKGTRATLRRRVTDPGRFTGSAFATMLRRRGAPDLLVELGPTPDGAHEVVTHRSDPLPEVLRQGLSYSNNFASEQLLRVLGWRMSGEPGDWTNGRLAVRRYWEAAGLPLQDLLFENASGLSSMGRVTAGGWPSCWPLPLVRDRRPRCCPPCCPWPAVRAP